MSSVPQWVINNTPNIRTITYDSFRGKKAVAILPINISLFQASSNIIVAINDVNNNPPYFMCSPYSKHISEVRFQAIQN